MQTHPHRSRSRFAVAAAGAAAALLTFSSPAFAVAPISYAPSVTYHPGTQGGPFSDENLMVSGDFRHTGHPDLLMVNFYTAGVTLLQNNGDGTFRTPGSQIAVGSNPGIGTLAVGDLNGDGNLDFFADGNDGNLYVMLGDGAGHFTMKASYSVPQFGQLDIATADFNGDGKKDVAIDTPTGVETLLGNGDGTFRAGASTTVAGSTSTLGAVAVANCNNDGKPDLYVSNVNDSSVIALKGNGDGSFTQAGSGTTSFIPGSVYAGHFRTGATTDDAVALNEATSSSTSMSYLKSDANCGFTSTTNVDAGQQIDSGAVADVNGDGNLDVVSSNTVSSQEVVLLGDGNGNFVRGTTANVGPSTSYPQTPVVADFNGDGKNDLATIGVDGSGSYATAVAVLLNNTN